MTREDLKRFTHTVEHSYDLRQKIRQCKNQELMIEIAKTYGFDITKEDFEIDKQASRLNNWFNTAQIPPIKKH